MRRATLHNCSLLCTHRPLLGRRCFRGREQGLLDPPGGGAASVSELCTHQEMRHQPSTSPAPAQNKADNRRAAAQSRWRPSGSGPAAFSRASARQARLALDPAAPALEHAAAEHAGTGEHEAQRQHEGPGIHTRIVHMFISGGPDGYIYIYVGRAAPRRRHAAVAWVEDVREGRRGGRARERGGEDEQRLRACLLEGRGGVRGRDGVRMLF